ncbi:uncharacterized protein PADG_11719 [Paracoccidioides brasiliensis Pb18]|uniref:Chitinase n=2 Tax=Paracoccidioides brasiliensis TaxID=121759 RepID=A0A0A0HVW7_PARBD|nr:uncharacterized protein PADG_11719 [Paracoccidioides brasiliensis Pb18]KGM92181.1 hypothetical protein PADG_11719 [Paracoccidioides brasiliensis Pb18]ODH25631.1 hypothetical protein ACO22_05202 [Paracoccidioides brasiliensis]
METGTDIRVKVLWYYGRILWEALSNGCEQIKDSEVHALGALQANVTLATSRVDIDWEYPVADRGGAEDGFRTYVQFSKELRAAVGNIYGITVALSDSYCLDLLWRNSVPPEKVSLGLAFYGRSFALADPSYTTPGCTFTRDGDGTSGGAKPGKCTLTSGTLSNYEINRILKENFPPVIHDQN